MNFVYIIFIIILVIIFFPKNKTGKNIQTLTRQAARYATAAQQDQSPIIATLHANYATGYLNALKDIATPRQINQNTGIDVKKFEEHILNIQDMVSKKVVQVCPEFAGEIDLYLSTIAGNN